MREGIGRAGKRGHAKRGQLGGQIGVISGGTLVAQRQQGDELHTSLHQLVGAAQQAGLHTALVEVGDQHQNGVARLADQPLAVAHGAVDVGTAAQLHAEQHIDRIVEFLGQVDHGRIEHHQLGRHGRQAGHHGAEDAGIDHRVGHGPTLVDAQNHLALRTACLAAVADQGFRHYGFVFRLPVTQIGANGAVPVDLGMARTAVALAAVQRTGHGAAHGLFQLFHQLVHHLAHHQPCRGLGVLRDDRAQRDQVRHQMYIGLHVFQHLGLQQQLAQLQPLHGVALHDLHDLAGKVFADIAEPARDGWRGVAASTLARAQLAVLFIQRGQGLVHFLQAARDAAAAGIGRAAQHHAPALQA